MSKQSSTYQAVEIDPSQFNASKNAMMPQRPVRPKPTDVKIRLNKRILGA